jgi:predicted regulator of Ras-like GTPase activity (Roadblock/LC7/MglB family)
MNWYVAPQVHNILKDLCVSSGDIDGLSLITTDGVVISSAFPTSGNVNRPILLALSTTLASIISVATSAIRDVSKGSLDHFYIKLEQGYIIAQPIHDYLVLIALCGEETKLGLVFLDLGRGRNQLSSAASEGIIIPRPPDSLDTHAKPYE